nr:hypothetical protein [Tanacetum cinerariifolium]
MEHLTVNDLTRTFFVVAVVENKDRKGYPISIGSTSNFSGSFSTGEYSNHQNHRGLVSTEGVFQKILDLSLGNTGGMFTGPIRTTSLPNHGPDHGWGSRTDYRMRKLKMPLFNRDDVYDWVYQAERFFGIQGLVTTGECLRAAMMCLEGPTLMGRPEIITVFKKMAAQLPGLQEEVQERIFIKGLKPDLRVVVRTQNPAGVRQAMELALLIDEAGKGGAAIQPNKVGGGVLQTSIGATRVGTGKAPFKRMTEAEMADKRAKGLCYQCDEKYGPGHRCLERALQVLWVGEDEDEEDEDKGEEHTHLDMVEWGNSQFLICEIGRTPKCDGHGDTTNWGGLGQWEVRNKCRDVSRPEIKITRASGNTTRGGRAAPWGRLFTGPGTGTGRHCRRLHGVIGRFGWPQNARILGYYQKFVRGYGKITRALTDLLKKDSFQWTEEATQAFRKLQTAMTQVPVLALPDFSKRFTVETDASGHGVGAVLMQEGKPIANFSQVLGPRAQKSAYKRKLMAIVMAVQKWRPCLLGCQFTVITDQKSLKFLLEQRTVPGEHQRWVSKLSGYDFEIIYRPRKKNGAADALSRRGDETDLGMLSVTSTRLSDEQQQAVNTDLEIVALKGRIDLGELGPEGCNIVDGMVRYQGRLVLPRTSLVVTHVFNQTHGSMIGGHEGIQKTYQRLSREFYWVGMSQDVAKMVAECDVCQRNKHSNLSHVGLLQPLSLPQRIWEDLTIDIIDGLPKLSGYSVILVVVDRLNKSAHFVSLKHPYTAASVATIFIREIVRLHGTAYHPQTDGQTEVVNWSHETYLRCFALTRPKEWAKWLPWVEYWYNTSYHLTIRMTPFKILYGRDPPRLISYDHRTALTFEIMKAQADGKRRDVSLEVAYKLKLPSGSVIHPVFHVSQLRKTIGGQQVTSEFLAGGDIMENMEPEAVIGSHIVDEQREVLIGWKGLLAFEATWELYEQMMKQFPHFHLEDK